MKKYQKEIDKLTDVQYKVTQESFTERPYTNIYDQEWREGIYIDIVSKEVLFSSKDKFDAGCGWPSFTNPVKKENVVIKMDYSHGLVRKEVRSQDADSHLGHVFNDGPEGQKRYCINSASLEFIPKEDLEERGYADLLRLFE